MKNKHYLIARFLEAVTGLYFVIGALPKAWDIDKFAVQMAAYKVLESPRLLLSASFFTVFVEVALGVALLVGLRFRGLLYGAVQAMLLVFSGLILYAWIFHDLKDCGCFPVVAMSPPVSLVKNLLIIASCTYAWKTITGFRDITITVDKKSFLKAMSCVVVGLVFMGVSWRKADFSLLSSSSESTVGIYAQFEIFADTGFYDLGEGTWLVPVMSTSCPECISKVPELNVLWELSNLPSMIALCYEDVPGDLENFIAMTGPLFPTYSLGDRALLYFTLIDNEPFKFVIVHEGHEYRSWDGEVPDLEELEEILSQIS
ncbi:MAG: hypothetical protein GX130_11090 [Candidatus Hydrogenedens sp.]|jgi:hypothetical protein|nr:hypothetical protein [Candidatus Hydrogenedens sp.]